MAFSEEMKITDNKMDQNKVQYNFDRQTAETLALSPGNVDKYKFLMGDNVLLEKGFLEKVPKAKRS